MSAMLFFRPTTPRPVVETVLALRRFCRIVHHVPGRILLRYDRAGIMAILGACPTDLPAALRRQKAIGPVEIDHAAGVIQVDYDLWALPSVNWERLLTGGAAAATAVLEAVVAGEPGMRRD